MMYDWLEIIRTCLSLFFFSLSSWYDYKKREVPNKIWLLYAPSGLILLIIQIFITNSRYIIILSILSIAIVGIISLILFYSGLFGGADAKGLISLSITMPVHPLIFKPYLNITSPIFPLSVFSNAVIFSLFSILGLLIYNCYRFFIVKEELFKGLEDESTSKKLFVSLIGLRVDVNKIINSINYTPLEVISKGEDGSTFRYLKIKLRLNENDEMCKEFVNNNSVSLHEKIWVTPNLPFLVFIYAGLIATILIGDILLWSIQFISF